MAPSMAPSSAPGSSNSSLQPCVRTTSSSWTISARTKLMAYAKPSKHAAPACSTCRHTHPTSTRSSSSSQSSRLCSERPQPGPAMPSGLLSPKSSMPSPHTSVETTSPMQAIESHPENALARTIANFALNRKEEPSPLAGRQLARNSVLGVGDEILKRRENADYPYALFTGHDCDLCSVRVESRACQRRPDALLRRAGEQGNLAPRPRFPQPDGAIPGRCRHHIRTIRAELCAAHMTLQDDLLPSIRNAPDPDG